LAGRAPLLRTVFGGHGHFEQRRLVVNHPYRRVVGHKMEIMVGKHRIVRGIAPKYPLHPIFDTDKNMNLFLTFRDLKLRWKFCLHPSRKRVNIARKWRNPQSVNPAPRPTCSFILHSLMPHRSAQPEFPAGRLDASNCFAVFKSNAHYQHKVTVGDIVQTEKMHRREAGEQVTFGTVLMVGSRDWTIIGKPTVPYAKVKATIEQQTLAGETVVFKYLRHRRWSHFYRQRQWVTMLRIDEIVVDPLMQPEGPPSKPLRLLDLWANRWLYPEELEGVKMAGDGVHPVVADTYDGSEHQPGSFQRRGLTEAYRFPPDASSYWQKQ